MPFELYIFSLINISTQTFVAFPSLTAYILIQAVSIFECILMLPVVLVWHFGFCVIFHRKCKTWNIFQQLVCKTFIDQCFMCGCQRTDKWCEREFWEIKWKWSKRHFLRGGIFLTWLIHRSIVKNFQINFKLKLQIARE